MAYPNQQYSYYGLLTQYQGPADVDPYQGIYCPEVSPAHVPGISPPPPEYARSWEALETAKPAPKKEKTVTFEPTCTVRTPYCDEGPTVEDKSRLYYSRNELRMMNLEANALCILSRALPAIECSGTHLLDRRDSVIKKSRDVAKDTPRGLELTMYPARRRTKFIANKSLLRYQSLLDAKPNVSGETRLLALAGASRKLTAWSALVAAETARWDALRAYDSDEYPIPIASEPVNITSPFPSFRKRRREQQELQEQHHMSRRVTVEDGAGAKRRNVDENV